MPDHQTLRAALADLHSKRERSTALARALGMTAIPNPVNLVRPGSDVERTLTGKVGEFYRVGEAKLGPATVGLYLAYADQWHDRSAEREPYRRRLARTLVEQMTQDGRWLCVLLDSQNQFAEAEFILPRRREGASPGTVRAAVRLKDPSRFHLELLAKLDTTGVPSLAALSRKWNSEFSVENVTNTFHRDFRELRDRFVLSFVHANETHSSITRILAPLPANRAKQDEALLKSLPLLAFGTRQLGRLLFLWFLQQKRWLGGAPGNGFNDYLQGLFKKHGATGGDGFFNDVLAPIFFDGLGQPVASAPHRAAVKSFGQLPFLGGGLFRPDPFEEELFGFDQDDRTIRLSLPDAVFDPALDRTPASPDRTVFGFLQGYRFTTQESTPDDQSVDPDPELLGKVFENLYQEDDRHQTGAYYTPREIVHYMCRHALDGYLKDEAGVTQDNLDWLRKEAIDWTVSDNRLDPAVAEGLRHALDNVTILDPACGSGAFLVGAMQEIVLLHRGLVQSETDADIDRASLDIAEWKRRAITQSLYGVDINPMAVEICKLRLWLSLVIDLELSPGDAAVSLPDLDFRILAGDSLVDRMGAEPFIQSLPDPRAAGFTPDMQILQKVNALQHQVEGWKLRFRGEAIQPHEQRDLSRKIRKAELEIARAQLDEAVDRAEGAVASLDRRERDRAAGRNATRVTQSDRKVAESHLSGIRRLSLGLEEDAPFQKPFLWPVNFHEVMSRGGFDIVLANPPYVRQESIDSIDQESYGHGFKGVHAGTADLLVYFYERAHQLLRDGGHLGFITSNKYMRAAYGKGIREFLPAKLQVQQVIDFGDLPLFSVAAYPAVVTARKVAKPDLDASVQVADLVYPIRRKLAEEELTVNHINVRQALESLTALLGEAAVADYPQSLLRKDGWILEDPRLVRLFDRLMSQGTPLGKYVQGRMYNGIKTGLNEAFVLSEDEFRDLAASDPAVSAIIRPWLRGQDVKRWNSKSHRYLLCVSRGAQIQDYPLAYTRLLRFKEQLLKRDNAGKDYPWWELSRPRDDLYAGYALPKVIFNRFANQPAFSYDATGLYHTDSCYSCGCGRLALLGVLNSRVCWWLLSHLCTPLQNGYLQLFLQFLERLPVPPLETSIGARLDAAVSEILGSPSRSLEDEIEKLIRTAYSMTDEEGVQIDEWYAKRELADGRGGGGSPDDE